MTRPDKHVARFGARYQPPLDWRRFRDGLAKAQPAIHRMTEAFRRYHEMQRVALQAAAFNRATDRWTLWVPNEADEIGPDVAWQPLTERYSEHFGDTRPTRSPAEFVQYADDILEAVGYDPMYPQPHQHTDEPWPYRGF